MSRPSLPPPPSVDELAELARVLAADAPALLPAFLWCLCRSSRAVALYRTSQQPSSAHLALLQMYPTGGRLISSSDIGTDWLRRWMEARSVLDDLLPPIAFGDPDEHGNDHGHGDGTLDGAPIPRAAEDPSGESS